MQEKSYDLAIAGELNLDLILYGLPLLMETERDLIGSAFVSTLGSSSAIVAHNAAKLGLRVQFSTLIGDDDFGRIALDRLRQAGVDVDGAIIDAGVTTGVTILLPHDGVRHSLSYLGSISALTVSQLDLERLTQARHFHLSSLYLQTGLHAGIVELLQYLKSAGLSLSLDPNDDPANTWGSPLEECLALIDVFMPNEGEICRIAGATDLDEAIERIGQSVSTIVVKRGRHGCRVRHHGQTIDYPGLVVTPVDTIGAGDSFDAGFLCAFLQGMEIAACVRAGNISGALSTLAPGGTEAFRDESMRKAFLREQGFPVLGD